MRRNMGNIDRGVRVIVGLGLIVAAVTSAFGAGGWVTWAMIAVGAILAVTALIGTCPLYGLFGIRTCRR